MSLTRRLRTFRNLPPAERLLLVQALVLLPVFALGLRMLSLRRFFALVDRLARRPAAVPADAADRIRRSSRVVALAARRGVLEGNCLSRSATLWWLLRRQGVPCDLRIGMRKGTTPLDAHAWVESQGVVLNDTADVGQRYVPFDDPVAS